jgi:hypothetical protein
MRNGLNIFYYAFHFPAASSFACSSAIAKASIICHNLQVIIRGIQEKFCPIL